jgi:isatin hydrolase
MDTQKLLGELAGQLLSGGIEVVDLSAVLGPETPLIKLPPDFAVDTPAIEIHAISQYDKNGPFWAWNWLKLGEHSGTHFDAPIHWITGKDYADGSTDKIPVKNFVGPVNVIDCSKEAADNHDFLLTVDHIKAWEAKHGAINAGEWVVMRTDWYKRNHSEKEFLNANETGPHTPGVSVECARWLAEESSVMGIGVETVGTDAGTAHSFDPPFPCHAAMLGAGKYGLTQLRNLASLPAAGVVLIVTPLPITGGSGSPCRALALVDRS